MNELVGAFVLGNAAILTNVCLLPLYPGLIAFLAGSAAEGNRRTTPWLGLAVLATVSSGRTATLLADGVDQASAAVGGFHAGFRLAAALVVVAVLVAVVVVRQPRNPVEG